MVRSAWRERFTLEPGLAFLNHGSFGAVPRDVQAAQRALLDEQEADPVAFMASAPGRLRAALADLAPRLGTSPDRLAFVENATTGVATVLRSLAWRPGDRVVTTTHGYNAVRQALATIAGPHGVTVDEVDLPFPSAGPDEVVAHVRRALPGARLLVIDAITSPTGLVLPFAEIVAAARQEGVPVLVDAAHAPGHVPLQLDALGADWVTGNLHKWWWAPRGTAILWAGDPAGLLPLAPSHEVRAGFPRAWDQTGTRDPSPWLSVPAALAFGDAHGQTAIADDNRARAIAWADALCARWGVVRPAPDTMIGAMVTLPLPRPVPSSAAADLHRALRQRGVQVPVIPFGGRAWTRISSQVYVTDHDIDRLDAAVRAELER